MSDDASNFKNGHVIYIFMNNGRSPTTTLNILGEHGVPATGAQVHDLVQSSTKAYPNLRRESDCLKLTAILEQLFKPRMPNPAPFSPAEAAAAALPIAAAGAT